MIKLVFLAAFAVVVWIVWTQYKAYKLNMEEEEALEIEQLRLKRLATQRKAQEVRKHNDALAKSIEDSKKSKFRYDDDDFEDDELDDFIEDVVGAVAVTSILDDIIEDDDVETVDHGSAFTPETTPEPARQSYEVERPSYDSYDSSGSDSGGGSDD